MPFSLQTSITPGRCIVFFICLSLTLMLSTSSQETGMGPLVHQRAHLAPRQNPASSQILSSILSVSTPTPTSTAQNNPPSQSSRPQNETPTTTTTTSPTSDTSTTPRQETSTTPPPQSQPTQPSVRVSSVQSTGADGLPTIVVVTVVASSSGSSPSSTSPPDGQNNNDESSGLGTGSIIGLSVAGGIALLGIIAFFVWKFTRKHRSATYDDGEIKWPDLNSESHVPVRDDLAGVQRLSDGASIRDQGFRSYGEGGLASSQSQVDLHHPDSYAVPPLPHLNPNQPYRDDPNVAYHDNFSAPAFQDSRPSSPSIRGEAIPMNQINRSRSPGPQDAYGGGVGRQSPGPQDAYGGAYGRRSPGPVDAYGAR